MIGNSQQTDGVFGGIHEKKPLKKPLNECTLKEKYEPSQNKNQEKMAFRKGDVFGVHYLKVFIPNEYLLYVGSTTQHGVPS